MPTNQTPLTRAFIRETIKQLRAEGHRTELIRYLFSIYDLQGYLSHTAAPQLARILSRHAARIAAVELTEDDLR